MAYKIENHNLLLDKDVLLENIGEEFSITSDELGNGVFLTARLPKKNHEFCATLGSISAFDKFVSCSRRQAFFQEGFQGTNAKDIPLETQWLSVQKTDGTYLIILPFLDEPARACLKGSESGVLKAMLETGSTKTTFDTACCIYIASGENPFVLMKNAAKSVAFKSKTVRLRKDKKLPEFIKYFGWCTWDSFYEKVSEEKVVSGLETFKPAGFIPKFLLIDDGWQSTQKIDEDRGHDRLTDFVCNEKFSHDLSKVVNIAKQHYGVEMIYVWHAIYGYWGGVSLDSKRMEKFNISLQPNDFTKDLQEAMGDRYKKEADFPSVPPEKFFDFYNEYHSYLRKEGVDGVKVDVQSLLEKTGENCGGRVRNARKAHTALESSVHLNFKGELINCMSTSNDIILSTLNSNMMRSSDDFFPTKPESHGVHIYRNAINSVFMSEFTHTDWDMFQTGHECGEFHATARAISGSPIYVSDKPDNHNFDIIKKLSTHDGEIFRAEEIARPTLDRLFEDPFTRDILFKIFNYNRFGGVIGAFNVQYEEGSNKTIKDTVKPSDIEGFRKGDFAVYSFFKKELTKLSADETLELKLDSIKSEIFTVALIENGFAPIGLADKYNSGGAILEQYCGGDGKQIIILKDGGEFIAYSEKKPEQVLVNKKPVAFTYENNTIKVITNTKGKTRIKIL